MSLAASPLFTMPPTAGLDVREASLLTKPEREVLHRADLETLAPVEAWCVKGTSRSLAYATHGVFRFFGKFPPPVASHLIEMFTQPGDLVIDPMCGSGTTGVECVLRDRDCMLGDVNPLSLLLARVKTRSLEPSQLTAGIARVNDGYRPLSEVDWEFGPVGLRNPGHWFESTTMDSLRGIRYLIEQEEQISVREALLVAFAATVRRVSRATSQQGRLFLDVATALPDALDTFMARAERLGTGLMSLPESTSHVEVRYTNMRHRQPPKAASLVILHPPYFNAYRYSSINSLELAWLGMRHRDVAPEEVREFFKVGKVENVERYVEDMTLVVHHALDLLADSGTLALMIGDTTLRGRYIPVVRTLIARLRPELELSKVAVRVPQFTEATWVTSQRRGRGDIGIKLMDFVLTFRRRA